MYGWSGRLLDGGPDDGGGFGLLHLAVNLHIISSSVYLEMGLVTFYPMYIHRVFVAMYGKLEFLHDP